MTTAGSGVKGFDGFYKYADMMSPLGNAPSEDCANYVISLFSDLTRMVTMQNLFQMVVFHLLESVKKLWITLLLMINKKSFLSSFCNYK